MGKDLQKLPDNIKLIINKIRERLSHKSIFHLHDRLVDLETDNIEEPTEKYLE